MKNHTLFLLFALAACSSSPERAETPESVWTPPPIEDPEPLIHAAAKRTTQPVRYMYDVGEHSNCASPPCHRIVDACELAEDMHSAVLATLVETPTTTSGCPRPYRAPYVQLHLQVDRVLAGTAVPERLTAYGPATANGYGRYTVGDRVLVSLRRTTQEWWSNQSLVVALEGDESFDIVESSDAVDLPSDTGRLGSALEQRRLDPELCGSSWRSDDKFTEIIHDHPCDDPPPNDHDVEDHTGSEFDDRSEGSE